MEELQTDTLSDYTKVQDKAELDTSKENDNVCTANVLNGCEDLVDPLDLMDQCDNESIGDNSDIWKGSDSEDENSPMKDALKEHTSKEVENENNLEKTEIVPEISEIKANTKEATSVIESEEHEIAKDDKKDNAEVEATEEPNKVDSTTVKDVSEKVLDTEPEQTTVSEKEKDLSEPTQNGDGQSKDTSGNSDVNNDNSVKDTPNEEEQKDTLVEKDVKSNGNEDPHNEKSTEKNEQEKAGPSQTTAEHDEDCQIDYEDEDFDPSLLCPEMSMDVDESPVVTTNGSVPDEGESSSHTQADTVFSTFVDEVTGAEVTFNLSPEEHLLRKRIYGSTNPVQNGRVHCTACNVHLGSALEGQSNRFVHPMLKVLICKECYHFYTSGDFDKDEDGSELYCRWCGQGGQVLCCSNCEYVFCKRCIRTNFGRSKMAEIRDSDRWECFRCNQSQITTQRIACYEFFEYVCREMHNANIHNNQELWSKDFTRCCMVKKRPLPNATDANKKAKKRKTVDPDYNPLLDKIESQSPPQVVPGPNSNLVLKGVMLNQSLQLFPKNVQSKDNDIEFVGQISAPQVTMTSVPRPTYRTILPTNIRSVLQPQTFVRMPSLVPTSNRILTSALQNRSMNNSLNQPLMKHEWFEKTVRAAARVNSHLSYTLTQLNKAQCQAGSIEELAVVHNKLQEILSSSINSLIQIRKNLRTEFISGIKTVRLPSKKAEVLNNDDDVILVSAPPTMPMPSTSFVRKTEQPILVFNPAKSIVTNNNNISANTTKTTVEVRGPKGFLKVKSVNELQNVPSECITIPDEPASENNSNVGNEADKENVQETDPLALDDANDKAAKQNQKKSDDSFAKKPQINGFHCFKETSPEFKKMTAVKVILPKVDLLKLQKDFAANKN